MTLLVPPVQSPDVIIFDAAADIKIFIVGICPVSPMVKENIGDRVLKRLEQEKVMPSGV